MTSKIFLAMVVSFVVLIVVVPIVAVWIATSGVRACDAIPCPGGDHAVGLTKPSGVVRCVCYPDPPGTVTR